MQNIYINLFQFMAILNARTKLLAKIPRNTCIARLRSFIDVDFPASTTCIGARARNAMECFVERWNPNFH